MIGRLLAIGLLGFTGIVATSASASGSGSSAVNFARSTTAAEARAQHVQEVERQRLLAIEADRRQRYASGEMVGVERQQYEAELAEKARIEREAEQARARRRAAAAAAAAARRSVRGSRSSGGGYSGGK